MNLDKLRALAAEVVSEIERDFADGDTRQSTRKVVRAVAVAEPPTLGFNASGSKARAKAPGVLVATLEIKLEREKPE